MDDMRHMGSLLQMAGGLRTPKVAGKHPLKGACAARVLYEQAEGELCTPKVAGKSPSKKT